MVARVYTSKEDFLSNVIRPFNTRMASPLRPTVRDMYADGDVPSPQHLLMVPVVARQPDRQGVARLGFDVPRSRLAAQRVEVGVDSVTAVLAEPRPSPSAARRGTLTSGNGPGDLVPGVAGSSIGRLLWKYRSIS